MSNKSSSKNILLSVIGIAVLVIVFVGVAFAFFNYTRTGSVNVIKVGRISFVTRQTNTINLTNLFPIDPTETGIMDDATKVGTLEIEIEGDTDYADGIEYLISSVDANIYTNQGQIVPISLDVTVDSLGTPNANYFTARENTNASIYKKLVGDTLVGDQMLLVGFIKPNTTIGTAEGIDGNITIKAYLDKNKILISDTYDGTESDNMGTPNRVAEGKTVITTSEWNALQSSGVSFKVKVEANEGIWVTGSLEEIMRKSAVMDNVNSTYVDNTTPGINFGAVSGDTNGKGVYMRAGTENDAYPIMYYRGEIEDNNVVFANKCWKAVRTTDTGGVKLIYNGEYKTITIYEHNDLISDSDMTYTNDGTYPYTYDGTAKTWTSTMQTDNETGTITFSVNEVGNYGINYEISSEQNYDNAKFYKNNTLLKEDSGTKSGVIDLGQLATTDVIKVEYTKDDYANSSFGNDNVVFSVSKQYGNQTQTTSCNNNGAESQITINVSGTNRELFEFNTRSFFPSYAGYMYGNSYSISTSNWTSGAYFGSSFTWDGTNYKLVDATETTPNATHHYSCNRADADATCSNLRYVYYASGSIKYYVTLTGGDGIEEALTKMQTNTNDSYAKENIDIWYENYMSGFTNKLEDTIWCNDRSIGRANGWSATGEWGTTDYRHNDLLFGAFERSNFASDTSTTKNQPSLICLNKNDRFTVGNINGNGALTYPIALLTEDEIVLAGGVVGESGEFYLNNEATAYWTMTPYIYRFQAGITVFGLDNSGSFVSNTESYYGLRPAISIKQGQLITKGTGTVSDPYVIE